MQPSRWVKVKDKVTANAGCFAGVFEIITLAPLKAVRNS